MTLRLLTVSEAAAMLGRRPEWVRARVRAGTIPARRDRSRYYIVEQSLREWLTGTPDAEVRVEPARALKPFGRRAA